MFGVKNIGWLWDFRLCSFESIWDNWNIQLDLTRFQKMRYNGLVRECVCYLCWWRSNTSHLSLISVNIVEVELFCIPNSDDFVNLPSTDWVAIWFDFFWFRLFVQSLNLSCLFLEMYPMGIAPLLFYIFVSDIFSWFFERFVSIWFIFCCLCQTRFDWVFLLC